MKIEFAKALQKIAITNKKTIFLTGDLGFNAFEELRKTLGNRFINAGVAEQNMLDVAAGMAYTGLSPWTYSIAPFLVLKGAEQIRNNICQRNLPVKLVANGGGYGYGIMGSTHHLLEDISILSSFPYLKLFIPAYKSDIEPIVKRMNKYNGPSYIRLGVSNLTFSKYSGFRNVSKGKNVTFVVLGPLLQNVINNIHVQNGQVDLWVVTEMPFRVPLAFYASVKRTRKIIIAEEHVPTGGLGHNLISELGKKGIHSKIIHLASNGYPSKLYGSQSFHHKDNGLDSDSVSKHIHELLHT